MRLEEDVFGKLTIPADALYGINTLRTAQNLSFSGKLLNEYPSFIKALAMVKKAAVQANKEAGILSNRLSDAIEASCDKIIEGSYHDQFIVDVFHGGGGIGFNMNINEVVSNITNEKLGRSRGDYEPVHPVEHVNASQSTSDVCHTGMRMAIIMSIQPLLDAIESLKKALKKKIQEFGNVTTISRTCLQDGLQTQLGDIFSGYAAVINRRKKCLNQSINQLYQVNLGGTVIGSGVGAPQKYRKVVLEKLCKVANLTLCHRENLFDAAQNMDDFAHVSNELRMLASCLIKMAKDLRLLSSGPEAGFAEIQLPVVQAGSSFFPGKVNPVVPETLIQCCFQVIAYDRAVQAVLEHAELDLNTFECSAGFNILDAIHMLEKALTNFTARCINGILANEERCKELSNSFIPTVVKLKEEHGYTAVAKLLKEKSKEEIKLLLQNGGDKDESNYE